MGDINEDLAIAGAKLFKSDCLVCHNMQVPDAEGVLSYRMTDPKDNVFGKQWIEIKGGNLGIRKDGPANGIILAQPMVLPLAQCFTPVPLKMVRFKGTCWGAVLDWDPVGSMVR